MKIVSKDVWEMFIEMYKSFKEQVSIQEELIKTQEEYIRLLKDDNQTYRDILNGRYVKKEREE